jgi:hypothetical protein
VITATRPASVFRETCEKAMAGLYPAPEPKSSEGVQSRSHQRADLKSLHGN